jgi:uncharacterized membrane protein
MSLRLHKERLAGIVLAVVTVAYPLLVYLGLGHFEPRWFAVILLLMGLIRLATKPSPTTWGMVAAALLLAAITWFSNASLPLKLYPVGVNLFLASLFAASLVYPPTVIERIARLSEPDLPAAGVAYARMVTKVWLGFFVLNGAMALVTTLWASDALWTLYNGLISYCLIGILGGAEWLVRRRVRRSYRSAVVAPEQVVHG